MADIAANEINRSIIDRFVRITRCLKRHHSDGPHLGHGTHHSRFTELTLLQMQALMYVKHHPNAKMSDLSEALGVSASSASLLVDRLVAGKWLERIADKDDRRVVYLKLRPLIRRHFEKTFHSRMSQFDQLLSKLSVGDRADLDRILKTLEESL